MRKLLITALVFALLLPTIALSASISKVSADKYIDSPSLLGWAPDRFIVVLNDDVKVDHDRDALTTVALSNLEGFADLALKYEVERLRPQFPGSDRAPRALAESAAELSRHYKVMFTRGDLKEAMDDYAALPQVRRVEPVGIHALYATPNDGYFSYQWHHNQASDHDIDSPEAWDLQTGSSGVVVAILDSGTRYYHPDLGGANASPSNPGASRGNMWINTTELNGVSGVDDDGNGYVDDWIGYDFIDGVSNCWSGEDCNTKDNDPRDFNGHGTHTAGIFGMITNDGYGMAGVAGGWGNGGQAEYGNGVRIMPLRMGYSYNYGGQEYGVVMMDAAAEAFYYAADNGASIASCSWGSSNSGGIGAAATYFINAGGVICVAAGNDGSQTADYLNGRGDCISVAATDQNDDAASFTTYGTWVDISAPGVGIYSTYHDHTDPNTNYWAALDGTSMATPMVAGVVALIWSQNPTWNAGDVTNQLYNSADNIDAYLSSAYIGKMGAGRINAYNAVNTGPPPPPVADFSGSPTSGIEPLTVNFTDASSGSITSWSWDFGDGGSSTAQNPSHTYNSAGTYTVSLTVTGDGGSDTETKTNYITVDPCTAPIAAFTGSPTSGNYPLNVSFTDQSSNNPTSWFWDFGDGGTSTAQNPSHSYTSAGTYTVSLTATNACGSDVETRTDYITVTEPTVDYATPPYYTGFESGTLDSYWYTVSSNSEGRIQITSANSPRGSYHLTMDDNLNGGQYAQNEAWLRLDLAGLTDVDLTFYWKEFSDETHTQDGVFFSDDGGTTFSKVYDLTGGSSTYQQIALDVDQLASIAGLGLTGTFVVKFQQYDNYGITTDGMAFDDIDVTTSVTAPPVAAFVGSPTSGTEPLTVDFTDQSTDATSWDWDFGDGGTSTTQNPSHTYNSAGTYTVSLTVTGPGGTDTETKTDYITVDPCQVPVAAFAGSPTSGDYPLTVNFTDQSTNGPTSWSWDFGDGGSSTAQNPSHTYSAAGTYTVALTAANACGSDTESKTDYITVTTPPPAPVAAFSGSPTSGCAPLAVSFTDESTGDITGWSWDFGDGGSSTAQNPSHTYNSGGTYAVELTVTGPGGSDTETKTGYITVTEGPTAAFVGSPTSGDYPLTVNFTDQSTGAASWSWDFGDGGTSTAQNPSHTYNAAGTYTVQLTATNTCGNDTETRTDYITVTEPSTDEMHVHSITISTQSFWWWWRATATITIYDQGGNPVPSATVYGSFSGPLSQSRSGSTNSSGQVSVTSGWTTAGGEWCFEVTNVTKSGWTYNPSANEVTMACQSGPVYSRGDGFARIGDDRPETFQLSQNYPNPFNPTTTIAFSLPQSSPVLLEIYNIAGQRVTTLADGVFPSGRHEVVWDASTVASGVYFYRIAAGDNVETRKMLLMK